MGAPSQARLKQNGNERTVSASDIEAFQAAQAASLVATSAFRSDGHLSRIDPGVAKIIGQVLVAEATGKDPASLVQYLH
jgi:hypothetical protein